MFEAYRNRVLAQGDTLSASVVDSTKRQVANYILDSPSLRHVYLNMFETIKVPCIVSNIETYKRRRFLFLPDMNIHTGDYIGYQDMTYLATDMTMVENYPELFGELCNTEYPISTKEVKIRTGTDAFGRPEYKKEIITITKPCVMTDKIYSQANNSAMPLPDGAIIVKLPYTELEEEIPKVNSIVTLLRNQYKVSLVSFEYVINGDGFIEVQLQRIPTL